MVGISRRWDFRLVPQRRTPGERTYSWRLDGTQTSGQLRMQQFRTMLLFISEPSKQPMMRLSSHRRVCIRKLELGSDVHVMPLKRV